MNRITFHASYIFWLLALLFCLSGPVQADISLSGYQQLGDNDNNAVTYSQLQEYPFYVSLTSDITLTSISLESVSGQEDDSSLVFFINGIKVATGQPGEETAALASPLSLSTGLHTLSVRGSCYKNNGDLVPCSGSGDVVNFNIPDLDTDFVGSDPDIIEGDLNNPLDGDTWFIFHQDDQVQITGNVNASIDLLNGDDRLDIIGTANSGSISLSGGDDTVRIGGNNNVSIDLGKGQNHLQIDGAHNSGTITGSNQNDIVKIKGSAYGPISLYAGANKVEIGGNFTSTLVTENQKDEIYIHGNVSGNINMGNGKDSLRIDGTITGSINGGDGNDTLYVNMTEDEWNNGWQKDNVEGFENLIFSDTPSDPSINENLDEDDFSFSNIIFHTSPSDESTNSIHFMQKHHLGDNNDSRDQGWGASGDGYGDIAEDNHPYYPDDAEYTSLSLQFTLAQQTSELIIDFYRLRSLHTSNPVYVGDSVGNLSNGGDSVDLGSDPYTLSIAGDWTAGPHILTIESEVVSGYDNDDFSWDQIIITPTLVPEIDHYRIEHPSTGITCQASTVTVRACANDNCSQEYEQEATITLSATSNSINAATWIGGDTRTFTGSVDFLLQQTIEAIETIEVSNTSPVATNPTRYYEDGVEGDDTIQFYDTAIFIDGDSSDTENDSDIVTQIAGKPSNENPDAKTFQVKVLRTDENTGACVPALRDNGTAQFSYLVPETANGLTNNIFSVNSNGDSTSIDEANTPEDLDLSFNNHGVASFDLTSTDTGKYQLQVDMQIPVTDVAGDPTGETIAVSDTSNPFIVRPLAVFVDASGGSQISANPKPEDAGGDAFTRAGETFTLNFKALRWSNNANLEGEWSAAPASDLIDSGNYARVPEWNIFKPEINRILPADNGDLKFNEDVTFAAGTNSASVYATFDDVGIIQFYNVALDFMGEEVLLNSPYIGRFIPHHFEIEDILPGTLKSTCNDFTYTGQTIEAYVTGGAPEFTIKAMNALSPSQVTQNYTGDFAKLEETDINLVGPIDSADAEQLGADDTNKVLVDTALETGTLADNGDGTLTYTASSNDEYKYLRDNNALVSPFESQILLQLEEVEDADNVKALELPMDVEVGGTEIRYGRIRLENAHGSELLPLTMPIFIEYYKEGSFRFNTRDKCTQLTHASDADTIPFELSQDEESEDTGWSDANQEIALVNGSGTTQSLGFSEAGKTPSSLYTISSDTTFDNDPTNLILSAPGAGNTGHIFLRADLTEYPWLQYDWNGDGTYDNNPTARATFGIFKGNEHIIYLRETTWR